MKNTQNKKNNNKVGAVLVIGGGIAGIQASLDLAESGQKVYLLENAPAIGGNMPRLDKTFPTNDCSMCILSPKIVECGRHLNIEVLTWSQIENISGSAGNFNIKVRKRARYVDLNKCTGCGECAENCPVTVPSEFDASLTERKAIFRSYPQAFPNAFVIDKQLFAPCRNKCPAGVNVQGFIALLAQSKFDEALELYRARNPFPASCGRICDHECEEVCNRGKLDEPLAIRALHRFLADREISAVLKGQSPKISEEIEKRRKKEFTQRGNGRKVAIIGAGPAGLTTGWDLANMGYKPTVFEALGVAGGMLRVGIPRYRLPLEVLDYEIEAITRAGVEINLNTPIGPNLTLNDLFEKGFETIFIAIGTHKSRRLGIEGEDLIGVIHGINFLHQSKLKQPTELADQEVVIIGGGKEAIDAARTSLNLGANRVRIICPLSREEIQTSEKEIITCEKKGVEFLFQSSPIRILGEGGKVVGAECVRMTLSEPDPSEQQELIPIKDSKFTVNANVVVPIIEEQINKEIFSDLQAVHITEGGLILLPGIDLKGVCGFTDLLRAASLGEPIEIGERVIIIGGGNVAIDVARTIVRLGNKEVHLACLESPEEMFASPEEIHAAKEEKIIINNRLSPKRIIGKKGHVCGIEFRECLSVFDSEGRFSPVVKPGSEWIMPADTVVVAIGQMVDWELLRKADGILATKSGLLEVNPSTLATNVKRIFAGGDVVTGPSVAVNAIKAGHKAAVSIDRFLNGDDLRKDREDIDSSLSGDQLAPIPLGLHKQEPRVTMPILPVDERIKGFAEVELGYTEEQAIQEAKRCLHCTICSECLQCVVTCKAEAICHDQQDEIVGIDVGALVVVTGFKEFMAGLKYDYGYSSYSDVVSSFEFERILSASGPFSGHVQRLSDGKEPKKIAFLQCIGSRDISCRNAYCSSVCCMYAIKEAVIAKEHMGEVDVTIFFMDMRAFGKDFDKYYERARSEYGVRFVRARVSDVSQSDSSQLTVQYADESDAVAREQFDMVVLSVGLEPTEKTTQLAKKLGVRLTNNGFIWTEASKPMETSRPGVFVGGVASGPKDIPETVTQASGTAGKASQLLAEARNSLTIERKFPPERDVSGQKPRIGVFICHCGINIGGTVDVPDVTEYAKTLSNVVHAENNLYTCSQDTQDHIRDMILEHDLNRVIVASCSPRTHEPMFRETVRDAGLNPYLFEMANIRDQCSWIHMQQPKEATKKAKDLVRMTVSKLRKLEPLYSISMPIKNGALVIGGGIAGMSASFSLAEQGFEVNLVEREKELGGNLHYIHYLPDGYNPQKLMSDTIQKVNDNPKIKVWTNTNIEAVNGFVGNFRTKLSQDGKETEVEHGVVIVATGAQAHTPTEYLYGSDNRVLTQRELEEKLAKGKFKAKSVVMIQCVGSREEGHMYCSRVCCYSAVKNSLKIKELSPETEVYILYRDMRTYGFNEEYFRSARDKGVIFVRYDLDNKPTVNNDSGLEVIIREPLLERELMLHPDLLVLSSRIDANADNEKLAQMLKIPMNEDGFFLEAHMKLRPVDFATDGIFVAGMAHCPKSIPESISQGEAAASRAATIISKDKYDAEATISSVNEDICSGCGVCVSVCEFDALEIIEQPDGNRVAKVNELVCKGCGCCAGICPSGAMEQKGFKSDQILASIEAAIL